MAVRLAAALAAVLVGTLPSAAVPAAEPQPRLAQQLPPVGQPIGPIRRGADGRIMPAEPAAPATTPAPAATPAILLPEILAVELPAPGMDSIAPTASPLRELLAAATADGASVTHDATRPFGLGATRVTWTAWEGATGGTARARRAATVFVLPHGTTPAGLTRHTNATGGNQGAKLVQDSSGTVHAAWLDAGPSRPGARVMLRRARLDAATGAPVWEGPPIRISDAASERGSGHVAIDVSTNAVHLAWQGAGVVHYRRLVRTADGWRTDPVRAAQFTGDGGNNGPSIAAESDDRVHLVTPGGRYAVTANGGASWVVDRIPSPPGVGIKLPSVAVDGAGNAHVTFTGIVRGPSNPSTRAPSRGYWELRYVRRDAAGGWSGAENVLAHHPEWAARNDASDVLADWSSIAVDGAGNVHVTWHGTAATLIYGNDEGFYIRKPASAAGGVGGWQRAVTLAPIDRGAGRIFSYAPSVVADAATDRVLAVTFYEVTPELAEIFDGAYRVLKGGVPDGPPVVFSRLAERAIAAGSRGAATSLWFPVAARRPLVTADKRQWLASLGTVVMPDAEEAPYLIVLHRVDATGILGRAR